MALCWVYAVGQRSRRMWHSFHEEGAGQAPQPGAFARQDLWFEEDCHATSDDCAQVRPCGSTLHQHGKIHGFVVLEPGFLHDSSEPAHVLRQLTREQGIVQRFFTTKVLAQDCETRLLLLRVLHAVPLAEPTTPLTAEVLGAARTQFFTIPEVSMNTLLAATAGGCGEFAGRPMSEVIQYLRQQCLGFGVAQAPASVAMASPLPHSILLSSGKWVWYAMPAPKRSSNLARYVAGGLVPGLSKHAPPETLRRKAPFAEADSQVHTTSSARAHRAEGSMSLSHVADAFRQALQGRALSPEQTAHYADVVSWVERAHQACGDRIVNTHTSSRALGSGASFTCCGTCC